MDQRIWDAGESECRAVMVRIGTAGMKFLAEDTQSERMQTSSRSKREEDLLKNSINHCVNMRASRKNMSRRKRKG